QAAALEKDAELDRRIAALRRKNEALVRSSSSSSSPRAPRIWGRPPRGGGGAGLGGGGPGRSRPRREWEQRRLQNIEQMNEEMEKIDEYERSRREGQPERNPVRNFLDDPRRCGPEPGGGAGGGARRHQRNWGGPDLGKARRGGSRFGEGSPPLDPTLWMTGRQRAEHERWKRERERIDRERLQRHRDHNGAWRREWDAQKPEALCVRGKNPRFGAKTRDLGQKNGNFPSKNGIFRQKNGIFRPKIGIFWTKTMGFWERERGAESTWRLKGCSSDHTAPGGGGRGRRETRGLVRPGQKTEIWGKKPRFGAKNGNFPSKNGIFRQKMGFLDQKLGFLDQNNGILVGKNCIFGRKKMGFLDKNWGF
uniref:Uncharacterized protein n=1 Tax=Geospiza parvula TaxID=87175 RepID=A0A8U8AU56_GEOPR